MLTSTNTCKDGAGENNILSTTSLCSRHATVSTGNEINALRMVFIYTEIVYTRSMVNCISVYNNQKERGELEDVKPNTHAHLAFHCCQPFSTFLRLRIDIEKKTREMLLIEEKIERVRGSHAQRGSLLIFNARFVVYHRFCLADFQIIRPPHFVFIHSGLCLIFISFFFVDSVLVLISVSGLSYC